MKKQLLVAAVAAASALSFSSALAADTLTLYGKMNIGLFSDKTGANGSKEIITANGFAGTPSRWGIKGNEEISPGLNGIFTLEYATFAAGNPGLGLRHRFVGLETKSAGKFMIGQTWDSHWAATNSNFDTADIWSNPVISNNAIGNSRVGSSLFWVSPKFGDAVTISINYTGDTNNGTGNLGTETDGSSAYDTTPLYSLGALYDANNLKVGLGYSVNDAKTTTLGVSSDKKTSLASLVVGYNFGVVNPRIIYQDFKTSNSNSTLDAKYTNLGIAADIPLGQSNLLIEIAQKSNTKVNDKTTDDSKVKFAGVEYKYNLSKRTGLYAGYTQTEAGDSNTSTSNNKATQLGLGVAHNF